ncbi:hypothetical protein V1512DRAFT_255736 [Lipomyces arxii]|uniref:uncharacterized protein n=1 Tax=Lipomyces arxii TaxID=56418 RepID=UPI0034CF7725
MYQDSYSSQSGSSVSRHSQQSSVSTQSAFDFEYSSNAKKGSTSSSSFIGGIFHLGRGKKSSRDDGSISPAKSNSSLKIPCGSSGNIYNGSNYSDSRLAAPNRYHTHSGTGSAAVQTQHSPKPDQFQFQQERTVRKQSSGLILPTMPSQTLTASIPPPPLRKTTPPTLLVEHVPRKRSMSPAPSPSPRTLILCTSDHEHFTLINISGLHSVDTIKRVVVERMQLNANILAFHLTELGELEHAEPLTDDNLLESCRHPQVIAKFFVRTSKQHLQSALDVSMHNNTSVPTALAMKVQPVRKQQSLPQQEQDQQRQQKQQEQQQQVQQQEESKQQQLATATKRPQVQTTGLIQPNQRVPSDHDVQIPDTEFHEGKFKVLTRPVPSIDFDQGRQSPYGIQSTREPELTALRNPPPPPPGRKSSVSIQRDRRSSNFGTATSAQQPQLDQTPSISVTSPMTIVPGMHQVDSPSTTDNQAHSELVWNAKFVPHQTYNVHRKPLAPSASTIDFRSVVDKERQNGSPLTLPPPKDEPSQTAYSDEESFKTKNEAFQENEISFDDAPKFPSFDDADDSEDDDAGLWAIKPSPESTRDLDSMPISLLPTDSLDPTLSTTKSSRPNLRVHIGGTEVIGLDVDPMSAITERTESAKDTPSATTSSPASVVSELPTSERFRSRQELQRRVKSAVAQDSDNADDGWAVRPPAEIVYDNLEKFFPNTDLDKPFIDDSQIYSPRSPAAEQASGQVLGTRKKPVGTTLEDPPVPELPPPPLLPQNQSYFASSSNQGSENATAAASNTGTQLSRGFSFRATSHDGIPAQETIDVQPIAMNPSAAPPSDGAELPESTGIKRETKVTRPPRPLTRANRMKSIRIVAREAVEARRVLKKAVTLDGASTDKNGATDLLRRKSTKMWGQRVVEVTANQIQKGQVRHNESAQQFNWVKGELIGKGTFGRVYLALNATTGEMIAVKQVGVPSTASDKDSAKQREVVDALNSEIETMKDLDHLNIVQYLGYEAMSDVCSLFLEYVPGGSIGTCLRKHGRFERPVIHSLTRQVVDGLAYLHSKGILHRDLKSDNLLLDLDGVCKISDFGISKRSQNIYSNDAEMSMQGTIFWMAPEVIHNVVHNERQGYSAKVDIWSLGCVVLEMFAGRRPWSNDEAIGAMYKLGNAKLAPPIPEDTKSYVCEEGKEFLNACFSIDAEARPTAQVLLGSKFCMRDPDFKFADTNLAKLIKYNDRRR